MSGEGVNAVVDTAIIFTQNMEALAEFYRQGLNWASLTGLLATSVSNYQGFIWVSTRRRI